MMVNTMAGAVGGGAAKAGPGTGCLRGRGRADVLAEHQGPLSRGWANRPGVAATTIRAGSHRPGLSFRQVVNTPLPGWFGDSESMSGRAIGAGGGGPHMVATDRGRRTYTPGPLTLRYACVMGAITVETEPPTRAGTREAENRQRKRRAGRQRAYMKRVDMNRIPKRFGRSQRS